MPFDYDAELAKLKIGDVIAFRTGAPPERLFKFFVLDIVDVQDDVIMLKIFDFQDSSKITVPFYRGEWFIYSQS